jgi:hypothetical protein
VAGDVDESASDMWHHLGKSASNTWHASIGCEGAMWPNHGLPRGTPVLVNEGYVKKKLSPGDSNPGPPHRQSFNKVSLTTTPRIRTCCACER